MKHNVVWGSALVAVTPGNPTTAVSEKERKLQQLLHEIITEKK